MARLASGIRVQALIRRVNAAGGSVMVLARGDDQAGGVLALLCERGITVKMVEPGIGPTGEPMLIAAGPPDADAPAIVEYWQRRRRNDPDLWVVEVDVAQPERFVAETILTG